MNELLKNLAGEAKNVSQQETDNGYTLVSDYPDFVVTKEMKRVKKFLSVLPSVGKCVIQTETANGVKTKPVTKQDYLNFTSLMPALKLPEGFWLDEVPRGSQGADFILDLFSRETLMDAFANDCLPRYTRPKSQNYTSLGNIFKRFEVAYFNNKELLLALKDDSKAYDAACKNSEFAYAVCCLFGLKNGTSFMKEFAHSFVYTKGIINGNINNRAYWEKHVWETSEEVGEYGKRVNIPLLRMDFESFRNYVLYESLPLGATESLNTFLSNWKDTLDIQHELYGKIREIFPKDLIFLKTKLESIKRLIEKCPALHPNGIQTIYNGSDGGYTFTVPSKKSDLCIDMVEQRNNMTDYLVAFAEGECTLLFMRPTCRREEPYITAAVKDGNILLAKKVNNGNITEEEHNALTSWIRNKAGRSIHGYE